MKYWMVHKPYDYIEVVCDDGTGPTETSAEVALIEAPTARAAKVEFVRLLRKLSNHYEPSESPFTGVKAEQIATAPGEDPRWWFGNDIGKWTNVDFSGWPEYVDPPEPPDPQEGF